MWPFCQPWPRSCRGGRELPRLRAESEMRREEKLKQPFKCSFGAEPGDSLFQNTH